MGYLDKYTFSKGFVVEYGRYWRDGSIQADSSVSSRIKKWSITPLNKSALLCFVQRELNRDLAKMSFFIIGSSSPSPLLFYSSVL